MKKCRQCGYEGEGNFCMMCGGLMEDLVEEVQDEQEEINRCPSCGEELAENARFCSICGAPMQEQVVVSTEEKPLFEYCDICGQSVEERSFICNKCARKNLCLDHLNKDQNCCNICAKMASTFEQVDVEKKMKKVIPGKRYDEFLGGQVHLAMGWIPPGEFRMGSERGRYIERPVHWVKISKGFWMSKSLVSQEQWSKIMAANPSSFKGDTHPVEYISWKDCQDFCKRLTEKIGRKVRLPTEAEWEYACRADSSKEYCFGDDPDKLFDYAWFASNARGTTHPIWKRKPNEWGMYGMHGNVQEWCQDWFDENYYRMSPVADPPGPDYGYNRVVRGGSWMRQADFCRSAHRDGDTPNTKCNHIGFRVVIEPTE